MKLPLLYLLVFTGISTAFTQVQLTNTVKEEIADVPFAVIEQSPVFPGCTGKTNAERKKCTRQKIQSFVDAKFDQNLIKSLQLNVKRMRISAQFKISKEGEVINVRARAPHPDLELEATRVVSSLPKMTPGKQRNQKVGTLYAIPIVFEFDSKGKAKKKTRKKKS